LITSTGNSRNVSSEIFITTDIQITFKFDREGYEFAAGNPGSFPIGIRDRLGNRLTIYRPPFTPHNYKFTRITSPKGRWVEVTWNSTLDVIAEVRDNANRVMSYSYDGSSRLTSVTDAAGGTTT
jgi:YD repeat-containing protein